MKIETGAARKYAGALFQVAAAQNSLDRASGDLREIALVTRVNPELLELMTQPRIRVEQKKELVAKLFTGAVDDLFFDFLQLLVDKRRFALIQAIEKEFNRLLDEQRRILPAEAATAIAMEADQQERLRQRLAEITGFNVQLTTRVDPELLGGLRIRMKGQLIDGSVATQLRHIRDRFKQVRVATAQ